MPMTPAPSEAARATTFTSRSSPLGMAITRTAPTTGMNVTRVRPQSLRKSVMARW